jgi:hypothetical protein
MLVRLQRPKRFQTLQRLLKRFLRLRMARPELLTNWQLSLQQNQLPKKRLPNPLLHQLVHLNLVVQPMRRSWRLFRLNDLIGAP